MNYEDLPKQVQGALMILKRAIRHTMPEVTGIQITIEPVIGEWTPDVEIKSH